MQRTLEGAYNTLAEVGGMDGLPIQVAGYEDQSVLSRAEFAGARLEGASAPHQA